MLKIKTQKKYPFNSKEDFTTGLYLVTEHALKYFRRYKNILQQFEKEYVSVSKVILVDIMIQQNNIIEGSMIDLIEALEKPENFSLLECASKKLNLVYDTFKDYEERLAINHSVLLNDFGDLSGASYIRFRKEHNKKKCALSLNEIWKDERIEDVLKKCQNARNYFHHFSEPKLITWRNFREDQLKKNPNFEWPTATIKLDICNIVNVLSILKLFEYHSYYFDMFNMLQFSIRMDYSLLAFGKNSAADFEIKIHEKVNDQSLHIISENGINLFYE